MKKVQSDECRVQNEYKDTGNPRFLHLLCTLHSSLCTDGTTPVDILNNAQEEPPLKRRAFTLIELLVVIALLTLLSALVVMAIGHMQTNGKRQQTRLLLQNLQAMFADYDVNRRVPFGAGDINPNQVSGTITTDLSLAAPGDVTTSGGDRYGSSTNTAVPITRAFMTQLISIPSNATAIGKLPSSSVMTFPGSNVFGSPPQWAANTPYQLYSTITYTDSNGNTAIYIRTLITPDGNGGIAYDTNTQAPPNYYYWMSAQQIPIQGTPLTTPVPLDAWGNPIIFVMGGVLSGVNAGGQTNTIVHSPDYHPFFASAGPDGNFSNGDDNMYSFEK
jgi:prepilin-type N-terminal cleavage/methylation domain-containing protein